MPKACANDLNIFNDWQFVRKKQAKKCKNTASDELWLSQKILFFTSNGKLEETYNDIIYISVHTFMCHTEINTINHELFQLLNTKKWKLEQIYSNNINQIETNDFWYT